MCVKDLQRLAAGSAMGARVRLYRAVSADRETTRLCLSVPRCGDLHTWNGARVFR